MARIVPDGGRWAMIGGLLVAVAAAACYEGAYVVQALEARRAGGEAHMEAGLLLRLVRRPLWVAATALSVLGAIGQVAALTLAPVTVVQPTLALGLILLLVFAHRVLGEPVGARELSGVGAVLAGVIVIGVAAPQTSHEVTSDLGLGVVLAVLAAIAVAPLVLRGRVDDPRLRVLAAAAGDVWAALGMKLVGDAIAGGAWGAALAWAVPSAAAGLLALTAEMSALQQLKATRVAPVIVAAQVLAPVIVAVALLGESWAGTPLGGALLGAGVLLVTAGAFVLGASAPVADALEHDVGGER
jgi:drug/metabolite transporter (DMT)-like permease